MLPADHIKTSIVLGVTLVTVGAALLLDSRSPGSTSSTGDVSSSTGDVTLTARLPSSSILAGTTEQDIALTITARPSPRHARRATRDNMSLAIVIDRSGSMTGEPMRNAKRAAHHLVDELGDGDAFSVATYASGDSVVAPIARATAQTKATAHAAIDEIFADGGTCLSCGLTRGAAELARTPVLEGIRRMVLISDGQANEGIADRRELAQLAADTAERGISISTVGVGLDFDELTMQNLASVGRGNYYFVEHTADMASMFDDELGGLAQTIATAVELEVAPSPDVQILEVYGYPHHEAPYAREPRVIIPIADLRAGETRKVVVHALVTRGLGDHDDWPLIGARLSWTGIPGGRPGNAHVRLLADVVSDPAEVAAGVDRETVQLVEQARSAQVLDQASAAYERDGAAAAQRVLEQHRAAVRANHSIDADTARMIEAAETGAADAFAAAPTGGAAATKAIKTTRASAYKLAR